MMKFSLSIPIAQLYRLWCSVGLPANTIGLPEFHLETTNRRFQELREQHNQRLREAYKKLKEVGRSAFQIMIELDWTGLCGEIIKGRDLPTSEQTITICETLAHLEFLRSNGSVVKTIGKPFVLFQKAGN